MITGTLNLRDSGVISTKELEASMGASLGAIVSAWEAVVGAATVGIGEDWT
jgi:hypothetical protein